jgi:hypothetical protein
MEKNSVLPLVACRKGVALSFLLQFQVLENSAFFDTTSYLQTINITTG